MTPPPLRRLLAWFAGEGSYMPLVECMHHDWPWIAVTVTLDLLVAIGYVLIARHWARSEGMCPDSPAKHALGNIKRIFIFCGLCGYLFIPIKMFWPAWRLYDFFLVVLVWYTWRYAAGTRQLRVIYESLNLTTELARQLAKSRELARRKSMFLNSISHHIRTPLNGISLNADLAKMYVAKDDLAGLEGSLAEIRTCTMACSDLLEQMLQADQLDWPSN